MAAALGVGLVGASGAFGRFIHSAMSDIDGMRLVAVSGRNRERTAQAAADLGASAWFTDEAALLSHHGVDIVAISTPPSTHAAMASRAMRAGKAVFLEKPAATTYAEGRALLETQQATGAVALVDFVMRYNPLFVCLEAVIRRQLFGALRRVDFANFAGDEALAPSHWFWDRAQSGGIFIEHGVHFFDLYGWLNGALPREVTGLTTRRPGTDQEDKVLATVRYENDTLGTFYHAFDKPSRLEQQTAQLGFDRGFGCVVGWIAMELELDGLVDDEEHAQLQELGFAVETVERYSGARQETAGNGQRYHVTRRVRARLQHEGEKEQVYRRSVRDALTDLAAAVRDPTHRTRVALWDGVLSSAVAVAAADRTAAAQLPEEIAWLREHRARTDAGAPTGPVVRAPDIRR